MNKKYDWVSFILHEANPNSVSIYITGIKIKNNETKFDLFNYSTIQRKLINVDIDFIKESLKIIVSSEFEKYKQFKNKQRNVILKDFHTQCETCNIIDNNFLKALRELKFFNSSVISVKDFNSNTAPLVPLSFKINKNLLEYSNEELIKFINKSIIIYSQYAIR